jgi:aquaporin Z
MNKYIAEFIGTFFLVLTIGCTGIGASAGVIAPLAIGAALMVMVFAGGHISGAHYNPAVTLGVLIRGKLKAADVIPYWIAQCVAAAVAAIVVSKILRAGVAVTPIAPKLGPALLAEFLFTFALVYVVLNAATAEDIRQFVLWPGNWDDSHDGSICSWRYLGRCVQPRRRHRHFDIGISTWNNIWIYLVADFAAGVAAAIVFNLINPPAPVTPIATDEPPYETPQ